jgi:hypothetical protein
LTISIASSTLRFFYPFDRKVEITLPQSTSNLLPPLRSHPQLYEISVIPWLTRWASRLGRRITLDEVPISEWERLRSLGIDLIYLMGIWKRSPAGRSLARSQTSLFSRYDESLPGWSLNDVAGSPFSIQAYEPDPLIGTWTQLEQLHRRLHDLGMRLILDVVPNHTGLDHAWVREHPEYYVRGALAAYRETPGEFFIAENASTGAEIIAYGRDPYFAPWSDTAQLNYFNPELRAAMIEQMRHISQFCDGARCDMAMLLLSDNFHQNWEALLGSAMPPKKEFWLEATQALPDFIWIAEAYSDSEWALQQLGFNFTYDKRFYDRLRDGFVRDVLLHLKADWDFQKHLVRFLENHDEARAATVFGKLRMPAVAALASTIPGMHFFHDGQMENLHAQPVVQLARWRDEEADSEVYSLYQRILKIADAEEFHSGKWALLQATDSGDRTASDLIAYIWANDAKLKLVVVNLGAGTATGRIYLPDAVLDSGSLRFEDLLNDHTYLRKIADLKEWGLFIKLAAFAAHIFEVVKVSE